MLQYNPSITGSLQVTGSLLVTGNEAVSGSLTVLGGIIGAITGSATSASYAISASEASKLQGLGSASFAPAATFNTVSQSYASASGSLSTRVTTNETNIATLTSASASFATMSGSLSTRVTNLEATSSTVSQSFASTSGSISSRVTLIEGQYATTGSNNFTKPQQISDVSNAISFTSTASLYTEGGLRVKGSSFISGTAYFNDVVVYGTSSIEYITSSQIAIGTNLITLNTDTPSVRYGGISVFDSGSNNLSTGSLFWDSEKDKWIYSNPSGSTYDGGMLISGPRNSSGLGNEVGTTSCALMMGQGGDHITSSAIFSYGNATCFYGQSYVSSSGAACFASNVCASTISSTTEFRLGASFARVATLDAGGGFGGGYNFNWNNASPIHDSTGALSGYGYANDGSIRLYANSSQAANTAASERMRITSGGLLYLNTTSNRSTGYTTNPAGHYAAEFTNYGGAQWFTNVANNEGTYVVLGKSRGTTVNAVTAVTNGDTLGGLIFQGTDGTNALAGSGIFGYVDGTVSTNNIPSRLSFWTSVANGSLVERMRISNTGITCFACQVYIAPTRICWTDTVFRTLQVGNLAISNTGTQSQMTNNVYYDNVSYKYLSNGVANRLIMTTDGDFQFETAAAGNLGCAVSLNSRLNIANTGPATFSCAICLAGGNIFLPGAIAGRGSLIEMTNSQTADILGMPNLSSTFYLSYSCNSITFRNDSGGTILQMYCNRQVCVGGNFYAAGTITTGGAIVASSNINSTSQVVTNSQGGFARMVHKIQGASGAFSQLVICVNLVGPGGWGYIINSGGTGGGQFQSGGGYTNGPSNFSHSVAVGAGFTVTCHTCTGTNDIVRFVSGGGVHPFVSVQMFGSLNQDFGDSNIFIAYS